MHLDYSIHPITGMERRVNVIVYMNEDWRKVGGRQYLNDLFYFVCAFHSCKLSSCIGLYAN